jgi:hypothetical protein
MIQKTSATPRAGVRACRAALAVACLNFVLAVLAQVTPADTPSAGPSGSAPRVHAVELAIETQADELLLPGSAPGNVVVTRCTVSGCAPVTLLATDRSRFFLGKSQISLEALRRELAGRPAAGVVVLYDGKSREVMRILTSAPAKAGAR